MLVVDSEALNCAEIEVRRQGNSVVYFRVRVDV
jgi:hypothetical protein